MILRPGIKKHTGFLYDPTLMTYKITTSKHFLG